MEKRKGKTLNKRVYGIIAINSIMAMWNADFTEDAKSTSDGSIFGSDKALKYSMRNLWSCQGLENLLWKTLKEKEENAEKKGKIVPKNLDERYLQLVGKTLDQFEEETDKDTFKNLFTIEDVRQFGVGFATKIHNLSITGAVQFGQGFNKWEDTENIVQEILSPFQNRQKAEAKKSSLGTMTVTDEAHYVYDFSINPAAYKEYVDMKITNGYDELDYEIFREGALMGATSLSSCAKAGCENEFTMFIETNEDLYLPNLAKYISVFPGDADKKMIKIEEGMVELLKKFKDKIQKIEVFYNNFKLEILDVKKVLPKKTKFYNIFTREEL